MIDAIRDFLAALGHDPFRGLLIFFLCSYPMASAIVALVGAAWFRRGRRDVWSMPSHEREDQAADSYPCITILIAAHNEEETIEQAIRDVLAADWPNVDLIVIDDGSTDRTSELVRPLVEAGRLRLLRKVHNEGKAMALNDGLLLAQGELVLILDADGRPDHHAIRLMAAHFLMPRVGAVTGNPRVSNTRTVLARLQAIEFSASVGVQRRSDEQWGRLTTVSGLCVMVRRSVLLGLGGFAPEMATEDIELTWRLELAGYDIVYEPHALFGMEVPETYRQLWRQRKRWALGLAQVIRRHARTALRVRNRRMWPLMLFGMASLLWVHLLAISLILYLLRTPLWTPTPHFWPALALAAACTIIVGIIQALVGCLLDRKDDPPLIRQMLWAPWYPVVYWIGLALCVLRETILGLVKKPKGVAVWQIPRQDDLKDAPAPVEPRPVA
jgi:biofilm PGA synthesis N-glycosyltransferase PgaC